MNSLMKSGCVLAVSFLASACAETQFVIHSAKELTGSSKSASVPKTRGLYKIGKPYRIKNTWYYPAEDYNYSETGIASWYGPNFHGKQTANGEIYNQNDLTAAHRTLPLPSAVRVTWGSWSRATTLGWSSSGAGRVAGCRPVTRDDAYAFPFARIRDPAERPQDRS